MIIQTDFMCSVSKLSVCIHVLAKDIFSMSGLRKEDTVGLKAMCLSIVTDVETTENRIRAVSYFSECDLDFSVFL